MDVQIKLIDGPLSESAFKWKTFIADEMNLSSNNIMMPLIPIFYNIRNSLIYFPRLQTPIKINPNFWFVAFQNYDIFKIRLDYPTVETKDIKNIS